MAPASCVRGHKGGPATGRIGAGRAWVLHALRSSVPTARNVTALSQMEQSARPGGGCSQVVGSGSRVAQIQQARVTPLVRGFPV